MGPVNWRLVESDGCSTRIMSGCSCINSHLCRSTIPSGVLRSRGTNMRKAYRCANTASLMSNVPLVEWPLVAMLVRRDLVADTIVHTSDPYSVVLTHKHPSAVDVRTPRRSRITREESMLGVVLHQRAEQITRPPLNCGSTHRYP